MHFRVRLLAGLVALPAIAAAAATDAVSQVLDEFHDAASKADGERYFEHFTDDAVFLGTDATERWTLAEFREYARPRFSAGRAWTYTAVEWHVMSSPDGKTAWFDEKLTNAKYGETRGTGVLRREGKRWKIAHCSLTILVPNDQALEVVEIIRAAGSLRSLKL